MVVQFIALITQPPYRTEGEEQCIVYKDQQRGNMQISSKVSSTCLRIFLHFSGAKCIFSSLFQPRFSCLQLWNILLWFILYCYQRKMRFLGVCTILFSPSRFWTRSISLWSAGAFCFTDVTSWTKLLLSFCFASGHELLSFAPVCKSSLICTLQRCYKELRRQLWSFDLSLGEDVCLDELLIQKKPLD